MVVAVVIVVGGRSDSSNSISSHSTVVIKAAVGLELSLILKKHEVEKTE